MNGEGVLILAETAEGRLAEASKELVTVGREACSSLNEPLKAGLIAPGKDAVETLLRLGVQNVYNLGNGEFGGYEPELYVQAAQSLISASSPRLVLLTHNSLGWDLAPRIAFRMNLGLVTDITGLSADPSTKKITQVKNVFGGNVQVMLESATSPQMASVRPKSFPKAEPVEGTLGSVVNVPFQPDGSRSNVKFLKKTAIEKQGARLEDAEVVVSGGRGVGKVENFKMVEQLALTIGAAVGCSKAVVDAGWRPYTDQVGLTGKSVSPKLYVAIGISGATQHMMGCGGAKVIVAINKDPEAPIFKQCHLGIVSDFKEVLPALIEEFRKAV